MLTNSNLINIINLLSTSVEQNSPILEMGGMFKYFYA